MFASMALTSCFVTTGIALRAKAYHPACVKRDESFFRRSIRYGTVVCYCVG
ncbi:hypothetical protein SOVF_013190 [Spinacia oleracea]|nr:hypothetical protein SOVF_013190 [Spinacia oleracea]